MDLQDGFGVTPDIRTRMKIAMFYVRDLMFLIIWAGIIFMISDIFPPDMQLETVCFWVVGIGYGVWLVCPSLEIMVSVIGNYSFMISFRKDTI